MKSEIETKDISSLQKEFKNLLDNDFKDYQFSVSGEHDFTSFQIKIVFTGTNSSLPARLKDLRVIALAV